MALQDDCGHAVGVVGGAVDAHGAAKVLGLCPAVVPAEVVGGGLAALLQVGGAAGGWVQKPGSGVCAFTGSVKCGRRQCSGMFEGREKVCVAAVSPCWLEPTLPNSLQ